MSFCLGKLNVVSIARLILLTCLDDRNDVHICSFFPSLFGLVSLPVWSDRPVVDQRLIISRIRSVDTRHTHKRSWNHRLIGWSVSGDPPLSLSALRLLLTLVVFLRVSRFICVNSCAKLLLQSSYVWYSKEVVDLFNQLSFLICYEQSGSYKVAICPHYVRLSNWLTWGCRVSRIWFFSKFS